MKIFVVTGLLVAASSLAFADPSTPASGPVVNSDSAFVPKKAVVERVVAVVNDSIILESELAQRARPFAAQLDAIEDARERQRQWQAAMRQGLSDMVDEELVIEAAAEAKLDVTEAEVDKALEEVKRQNKVTDKQLAEALATQGYTVASYRKDIKKQIVRLRAVNVLVRPRVSVTDDEVKEKYERMVGKSSSVTEVHVRHILVKLPEHPGADALAEARRRAGELVARARSGEDFVSLARERSQDSSTKDNGGDLGWFKRGELPTEWEEVLFAMADGEVRGPIQGPQGLHVFQLAESKKEATRPFDEVKEQLRTQIFNDEMEKQTKVWLEELHKAAHVEVKL